MKARRHRRPGAYVTGNVDPDISTGGYAVRPVAPISVEQVLTGGELPTPDILRDATSRARCPEVLSRCEKLIAPALGKTADATIRVLQETGPSTWVRAVRVLDRLGMQQRISGHYLPSSQIGQLVTLEACVDFLGAKWPDARARLAMALLGMAQRAGAGSPEFLAWNDPSERGRIWPISSAERAALFAVMVIDSRRRAAVPERLRFKHEVRP